MIAIELTLKRFLVGEEAIAVASLNIDVLKIDLQDFGRHPTGYDL